VTYLVRLSPNARRDRDRLLAWYDDPERGQGDRFLRAFYTAAHQLEGQPLLGHVISGDVRSWHLPIFRYQLWYRVAEDLRLVRIIALVGDRQDHAQFEGRFE